MKDYTTSTPQFSNTIKILEVRDPGHADNVNVTTKQLLENTLVNRILLESLIQMISSKYDAEDEIVDLGLRCAIDEEIVMIPPEMGNWEEESELLTLTNQGIPSIDGGISGGSIGYILQPATQQRLGGVKIGQGIDVDTDGTISANVDTSVEKAADLVEARIEEFSQQEIQALFQSV